MPDGRVGGGSPAKIPMGMPFPVVVMIQLRRDLAHSTVHGVDVKKIARAVHRHGVRSAQSGFVGGRTAVAGEANRSRSRP